MAKKEKTTVEQVEENLTEPEKPEFGMEEIKNFLPKLAEFHGKLSEFQLEQKVESTNMDLALTKISSSVTLLTKFYNEEIRNEKYR